MINKFEDKLLIAEIGSVHDGSFGNACNLIRLAADCGAEVVKFQTHIAEEETLRNAPMPEYFKGEPRYEYFQRTSFTKPEWEMLISESRRCGVNFLSSPFSIAAIELLESIGAEMYKVASGEVNNIPLLEKLASIGKPVVLSSGMSSWAELDHAISILVDNVKLCVMQCSSAYPCPLEYVGLNVLGELKERYEGKIMLGFSDHTAGLAAGPAAAACGANIIEKHLTFSKAMYGSDAANALEPEEYRLYSKMVHETWQMLSHPVNKDDLLPYKDMKLIFEKSIVSSKKIIQGEMIKLDDLCFKKPGDGIPAKDYRKVIGLVAARNIDKNHKFKMEDFK